MSTGHRPPWPAWVLYPSTGAAHGVACTEPMAEIQSMSRWSCAFNSCRACMSAASAASPPPFAMTLLSVARVLLLAGVESMAAIACCSSATSTSLPSELVRRPACPAWAADGGVMGTSCAGCSSCRPPSGVLAKATGEPWPGRVATCSRARGGPLLLALTAGGARPALLNVVTA